MNLSNKDIDSPKVIKLFFVLNSTEHKFIMLINVKMPTIVGILTLISMINTAFVRLNERKVCIF